MENYYYILLIIAYLLWLIALCVLLIRCLLGKRIFFTNFNNYRYLLITLRSRFFNNRSGSKNKFWNSIFSRTKDGLIIQLIMRFILTSVNHI